MVLPFQFEAIENHLEKFLHRMSLAGGNYVVVGLILLQHQPHRLDVVAGESPIAARVQVSERQLLLDAHFDPRRAARDLARHEVLAAPWRLVIEEYPVACEQLVGLAIVDRLPVSVDLGARVRTARMKRRGLALRILRYLAEHLRRARLVKLRRSPATFVVIAQRLEQSQRPQADHIGSVFRLIERDTHVRLCREIVNLVGTHLLDNSPKAGAEVAVMELQTVGAGTEALAQMIDSSRRETRSAAYHAVHFVTLLQQKL